MQGKRSDELILSLVKNAVNTASEGITISSILDPDQPLIFVNDGFERMTGYSNKEVLGKNCRFLQGIDTDTEEVDKIRNAIRNSHQCTVELLNYKKDGTPFWNRLSITPLLNTEGVAAHYVGVQSDITEIKETRERLENANSKLEEFRHKIIEELDQAKIVQNFILPEKLPENEQVRFSVLFKPADQIGGDFYNVIDLGSNFFGVLVADVTGHGIPAALLTFMSSFAFTNSATNNRSTKHVIASTNKQLYSKMPRGAFVTMFYAIYDSEKRRLVYTQAGHPDGLIIRASTNEVIPLTSKGILVGAFSENEATFEEASVQLEIGDKVLLYSDALIEIRSNDGLIITDEEFKDFLKANSGASIQELINIIYQFGINYSNDSHFTDDLTIVGWEVMS